MFLSLIFNLMRYGLLLVLFFFVLRVLKAITSDLKGEYLSPRRSAPGAVLVVEKVEENIPLKKGTSFSLGQRCTVGRAADNDLVIPSPYVSQYHAVFQKEEDCYFLEDLNSTNGTYLNGKRLSHPQNVDRGDLIFIGGVTFRFKYPV